jgi:Z1 domain
MAASFEEVKIIAQTLARAVEPSQRTRPVLEEKARAALLVAGGDMKDLKRLTDDLHQNFNVWVGEVGALDNKESQHIEWLDAKRSRMERRFWTRYQTSLRGKWALPAIEGLDTQTDEILRRLEDPERPGAWDTRGLVVGHVQSGKTANYTGLLAKAADAGYKVLVVLAGMLDDLRTQTQVRLEEDFLGYDRLSGRIVGVGEFDRKLRLDSVTTRAVNGDLSRAAAQQFSIHPGGAPLLFVIKKNASVLKNLLDWVKFTAREQPDERIHGIPLLVVDDEADHGSIDTKEQVFDEDGNPDLEHDPTVLNGLIRKLLHKFEQKAYVGYTATPFANIFIYDRGSTREEGPDLFPSSFIISLPAASNYIGPNTLFGASAPNLVKLIDEDAADSHLHWMPQKHKKDHRPDPEHFPESLRQALRSFVLSCAARRARGQQKDHSTMLVHVTRLTDVQAHVANQIEDELNHLRNAITIGGPKHLERMKLKELWATGFAPITKQMSDPALPPLSWPEIEKALADAVSPILVRRINGTAGDVLDYHAPRLEGLKVIAVGGDKLSRGLTLQGLSVSYFLRTTKMYDTLMQMGRWFGYRPGYLDLCRIWMTAELKEWFEHITKASNELRSEFDAMVARGGSPRNYGLKVQSHPVMAVTSAAKMRHAETLKLSYGGTSAETTAFDKSLAIRDENWRTLDAFIKGLGNPRQNPQLQRGTGTHTWKGASLWSNVPAGQVVSYLRGTKTHEAAVTTDSWKLAEFIERQAEVGELTTWSVGLMGGGSGQKVTVGGYDIRCIRRKPKGTSTETKVSIGRVMSPRDEAIDFDNSQWRAALELTPKLRKSDPARAEEEPDEDADPKEPKGPSGPAIRHTRAKERGLLLLYPLDPSSPKPGEKGGLELAGLTPVAGFAVSFPRTDSSTVVDYEVNRIFQQQEFGIFR